MRSNGLRLALALLLAPATVCAQTPAPAAPTPEQADTADAAVTSADAGQTPTETAVSADTAAVADPAVEQVPTTQVAADQQPPAEAAPAQPGTAMAGETAPAPAEIPVAATADGATPQTEAEQAFNDIYGTQDYDPVADPTLPDAAVMPVAFDPWEGYNRRMHRFNNAVDRTVAQPLARGYVKAVPRPVRLGVSNFFNNLGQPLTMVNSLLQGKGKQAGQALGRFLLNSTFGIGGIFDPASRAQLPKKSEDFGQTLGVWGWKRSRYFELPLFGPRTVRDVFGMAGDSPLSPLRGIEADRVRIPLQGVQLVDVRAQLLATDSLREGAEDDYALVRDAWSQRRDYQIFGDRSSDQGLPDYLREGDDQRIVPVDAMPVLRPDGN
ncbi:MlaA family lipoprotein [Lysobacter niabensis]|uniref:MlaA family lipoprotein n=1 Tax=Agrilutibacter niabensis TaxID=380628 RepID=UPI0036145583